MCINLKRYASIEFKGHSTLCSEYILNLTGNSQISKINKSRTISINKGKDPDLLHIDVNLISYF